MGLNDLLARLSKAVSSGAASVGKVSSAPANRDAEKQRWVAEIQSLRVEYDRIHTGFEFMAMRNSQYNERLQQVLALNSRLKTLEERPKKWQLLHSNADTEKQIQNEITAFRKELKPFSDQLQDTFARAIDQDQPSSSNSSAPASAPRP